MTDLSDREELAALYRDLHAHPELAFAEHRTAGIVAERLQALDYQVTTGVGGTGGADVPVMHACGHDMHVSCLLGAAAELAARARDGLWQGRLLLVFQPAEEAGRGAQAMIDDGLYARFGLPAVVLGQHVTPMPAGLLGVHPGAAFAASDSLRVLLHGRGGHGSRPHAAVDPVLMAAATVLRLQGIVAREVAPGDLAIVTAGALRAGSTVNTIPDQAELLLSVRTFDEKVRAGVLGAIERIVRAEAAASGAPAVPEIEKFNATPVVVNDAAACARLTKVFNGGVGPSLDPGPLTSSEDVGVLASEADAPCGYWLLGGADPALFAGVATVDEARNIVDGLPSNHSPLFAPVIEPTLRTGVAALTSAARAWLAPAPG